MAYLVDSNILLRLSKLNDVSYPLVRATIEALQDAGEELCFTPQNLVEFWSVSTRPAEKNGLGLTTRETDENARSIEAAFTLLPDNEQIHGEWRHLVMKYS